MKISSESHTSSTFVDVLLVLSRWKRFILLNVLIVTLLSAGISFLLPRWYASSATVLPPKNQNLFGNLGISSASLMRQLGPLRAIGSLGQSPDIYSYLAILKSRTLMERVVNEFDLTKVYSIRDNSMGDAIEELSSNIDIRVSEEGTLRIEVSDRDAERATRMANYFVAALDELNRDLNVREARSNREFIEQRVGQNIADLKKAEEDLKKFQERHGFVGFTQQSNSAISGIAELYTKKALKELEIGFLKRALGDENPQLEAANLQLSELNAKLENVPELGTDFLRLYREFAIQQRLFETLLPLLEQAKIEEKRDTPTLLVLDRAVVPELPYRPRKRIIVLVFFFLSLLTSIAVVLLRERMETFRQLQPDQYEKLVAGWRQFRLTRRRK